MELQTNDHVHCWHLTAQSLTSLPPKTTEACCWCGVIRQIMYFNGAPGEHGPHIGHVQPRVGPSEFKGEWGGS